MKRANSNFNQIFLVDEHGRFQAENRQKITGGTNVSHRVLFLLGCDDRIDRFDDLSSGVTVGNRSEKTQLDRMDFHLILFNENVIEDL